MLNYSAKSFCTTILTKSFARMAPRGRDSDGPRATRNDVAASSTAGNRESNSTAPKPNPTISKLAPGRKQTNAAGRSASALESLVTLVKQGNETSSSLLVQQDANERALKNFRNEVTQMCTQHRTESDAARQREEERHLALLAELKNIQSTSNADVGGNEDGKSLEQVSFS